jgi:hypothetical protein
MKSKRVPKAFTWASPILTAAVVLLAPRAGGATVGWWRFEEGTPPNAATGPNSVLDSSGHNLNGTPGNGPLYSADVSPWSGAIGSARSLHFNGSNNRLFVPDSPALQLTHSLTVEALFRTEPMRPGTGAAGNLLTRGDNRPGLDPFRLSLMQPGNGLIFQIVDGGNHAVRLSYTVPFDQWVFAAGTLDDATGLMNLYVNGSLVASTTTSIRPLGALDPAYAAGLGIGSDQTGQFGELLNGWLDEVRLSDTALRPDEFLVQVPEPSAIALIGVGAAMFLRRRRSK